MTALGLVFGAVLGGCTTALPPDKTPALGSSFNEEARVGYVALADAQFSARDEDYFHFKRKARLAMFGGPVWPDQVGSREVAPEARDQAVAMRARLVRVLEAGGREQAPEAAATAQVSFDCWLKNQDEVCKERFDEAIAATEGAVLGAQPGTYVVFFESASDFLLSDGHDVATKVARAAALVDPAGIKVVGFADPSGSASFNQDLSQRRAEAVAVALQDAGIAPELIAVDAGGVGVPGPDGRRVEISFAN